MDSRYQVVLGDVYMPVSYTHLDVYKRQDFSQMIHKHGVFLLSTRFEVHVNTVLR